MDVRFQKPCHIFDKDPVLFNKSWPEDTKIISRLWDVAQDLLSVAQAIPVAGPLVVSAIKAKVSVIQVISSLTTALVFTILKELDRNLDEGRQDFYIDLAKRGSISLLYAGGNFATFGILGLLVEFNRPHFVSFKTK